MPTSTRSKPAGRRKPVSSAGQRTLHRVKDTASRRWKRTLKRHPSAGVIASIVLALVGVALLALGLLAENLLYFLAAGLSGLGAVAVARSKHLQENRPKMKAGPKVKPQAPRTPPEQAAEPRAAEPDGEPKGVIKCTRTGKPTGDCDCATRGHVMTAKGKARYGGQFGDPIGARNRNDKTTKAG